MSIFTKYNILLVMALLLSACKNDKEKQANIGSDETRKSYLENLKTNFIGSGLLNLKSSTQELILLGDSLINNPNKSNLEKLQQSYDKSYQNYLKLDAFRFGPFKDEQLNLSLFDYVGIFPCNINLIETKIQGTGFNPNDFNTSCRGFCTVDYLIFDINNNQDSILQKLRDPKRSIYLKKNFKYIDSMVLRVLNNWKDTETSFSESASTAPGSNLSEFFNSYLQSFETAKNNKLQIPGGFNANALGQIYPKNVESYYSGYSKNHLKVHVSELYKIWKGEYEGFNGVGFDDIVLSQTGDTTFVKNVYDSFEEILNSIDQLPSERIDKSIVDNNVAVKNVYDKMASMTHFIKSDMVSKFSFSITYSSNDGD